MPDEAAKPTPAEYRTTEGKPSKARGRGGRIDIKRIADVRARVAVRQPSADIQREVAAEYSVTERCVRNDIRRVEAEFIELRSRDREVKAAEASHTALTLMRLSLTTDTEAGRRTAQRYFSDYCRLEGLYASTQSIVELPTGTGVLVVPPQDPKEELP